MLSYMKQKPGFYREVVTLAMPIMLQNLVTTTLAMADTFMVGMLGELPMAAVALANIPLFMVDFFIFLLVQKAAKSCCPFRCSAARRMASISRVSGITVTNRRSKTQGISLFQIR